MKKYIFLFASIFMLVHTDAMMVNEEEEDDNNFLSSAKWLQSNFDKRYRNARLAFRNAWPDVVDQVVERMREQMEQESPYIYMKHFVQSIIPDVKRQLLLENGNDYLKAFEQRKVDCGAGDFMEKAIDVLATGVLDRYKEAYNEWHHELMKDVENERKILSSKGIFEGLYDKVFGFVPKMKSNGLWNFFKNRFSFQVTDDALVNHVLLKRRYKKLSPPHKVVANIGKACDVPLRILSFLGVFVGLTNEVGDKFQEAVIGSDMFVGYVSDILKVVSIVGATWLASNLVGDGFIVSVLSSSVKGPLSVLGSTVLSGIFPAAAAGAAAYYFRNSGWFKVLLITAAVALVVFFIQLFYLKIYNLRSYRRVKGAWADIIQPFLLISSIIAPPTLSYQTYQYLMYTLGIPLYMSLFAAFMIAALSFYASASYVFRARKKQLRRERGNMGIWAHMKEDMANTFRDINNGTSSLFSYFARQKSSIKVTVVSCVGILIIMLVVGCWWKFSDGDSFLSRFHRSTDSDSLEDLNRRNSVLLDYVKGINGTQKAPMGNGRIRLEDPDYNDAEDEEEKMDGVPSRVPLIRNSRTSFIKDAPIIPKELIISCDEDNKEVEPTPGKKKKKRGFNLVDQSSPNSSVEKSKGKKDLFRKDWLNEVKSGRADINEPNKRGFTPLSIVVSRGDFDLAKLLLENGADPNKENKDGDFPLSLFVERTTEDDEGFFKVTFR